MTARLPKLEAALVGSTYARDRTVRRWRVTCGSMTLTFSCDTKTEALGLGRRARRALLAAGLLAALLATLAGCSTETVEWAWTTCAQLNCGPDPAPSGCSTGAADGGSR